MSLIIHLVLALVFSLLASFHFYWMLGYQGGLDKVVPTTPEGNNDIQPGFLACLIVALGLTAIAIFYLQHGSLITHYFIPPAFLAWIGWSIPIIFFFRAIGEFNYVGLFKKVKNTKFATADDNIYIPLCFSIALLGSLAMLV